DFVRKRSRCAARVGAEIIDCDWIVGADGLNSAVRRWARLNWLRIRCRPRLGFRRHFSIAPWSENVEVFWGSRFQMVVTPTQAREVCVSFFTRERNLRIEDGLAEFPEIGARLRRAEVISTEQGAMVGLTSSRRVTARCVALVGDASCSVDGIAGHGL